MLVKLEEDVEGLGKAGDVVDVGPDYARAFLLPGKLAVKAEEKSQALLDLQDRHPAYERWGHKFHAETRQIADRLASTTILIRLNAGNRGIKADDIAEAVKRETGFVLPAGRIRMEKALTRPGTYLLPVKLHRDVQFDLKVEVVAD